MRISTINNGLSNCHIRQSGTTLIEILIFSLILGLVSGIIVLTATPEISKVEAAAYRLGARIQKASQFAVISGNTVGLDISDTWDSYVFKQYRDREWQQIPDQAVLLTPEILASGIGIQINYPEDSTRGARQKDEDDRFSFEFSTSFDTTSEKTIKVPEFIFSATGEMPEASIILTDTKQAWEVTLSNAHTIGKSVVVIPSSK